MNDLPASSGDDFEALRKAHHELTELFIQHLKRRWNKSSIPVHREKIKLAEHVIASGPTLSVNEAAAELGRSSFTVRQWCRTGQLRAYRAAACGSYVEFRIPIISVHLYRVYGLLPADNSSNSKE